MPGNISIGGSLPAGGLTTVGMSVSNLDVSSPGSSNVCVTMIVGAVNNYMYMYVQNIRAPLIYPNTTHPTEQKHTQS